MTITAFNRIADYACVGRNGLSKAAGISVEYLNNDVLLRQLNTQGQLTNCRIVVPREHAAEVAASLLSIDGDAWEYDAGTQEITDQSGVTVARGVVAGDAATVTAALRLVNAEYLPGVVRAARALLDAFGPLGPIGVAAEVGALEDALNA